MTRVYTHTASQMVQNQVWFPLVEHEKSSGPLCMGALFEPIQDRFCRLGRSQEFYPDRLPHVQQYFRVPGYPQIALILGRILAA